MTREHRKVIRRKTGARIQQPNPRRIVVEVQEADLNEALLEVRPTAMQEVFLETPKVQWSDIGGQQEVKRALRQAVEWPLKV